MLNISNNPVFVETEKLTAYAKIKIDKAQYTFRNWLLLLLGISTVLLFFPWTQNISAKGEVTMLSPQDRPQDIEAVIAGRIEKWYVSEGQFVKKGDTIIKLSEIKSEYFDPQLIERTEQQVKAKKNAVETYNFKTEALENQSKALESELRFKKQQIENKLEQMRSKIESDKNDLVAANLDVETEQKQLLRTEEMFKEGLKSLSEVENKRLKLQQTQSKKISAENKLLQSNQELSNLEFQKSGAESEYRGKIAKAQSDKLSAVSDRFEATGTVQKLQSQLSNYIFRAQFYFILAPQDCYISKATKVGISETVKEGEELVSVVPAKMNLAVEMFIKPIDLPLAHVGAPVRLIFDGYPSIFFSGWPETSTGSFDGKIFAIDNVANDKGKYRVLVSQDSLKQSWPKALRSGSGAQSFALLKDVPVWYELWRQISGFPPEYYKEEDVEKTDKKLKIKIKKK